MEIFIFLVVQGVNIFLSILQMLMLARAIMSWLPFDEDSALQRFLYYTTEPIIIPVRMVLERIDLFSGLPIDLSFMFTYMIIIIIQIALPEVHF